MNPIAYVDGYTSSDTSNADGQIDRMFLDVGEHQTIAMIEVNSYRSWQRPTQAVRAQRHPEAIER